MGRMHYVQKSLYQLFRHTQGLSEPKEDLIDVSDGQFLFSLYFTDMFKFNSFPIAGGGEGGANVQHVRDSDGCDSVPLQPVPQRNRPEAASASAGTHRLRRPGKPVLRIYAIRKIS